MLMDGSEASPVRRVAGVTPEFADSHIQTSLIVFMD